MIEPQPRCERQRHVGALALSHRKKNLFFNSDVFQERLAEMTIRFVSARFLPVYGLGQKLIQSGVFRDHKLAKSGAGTHSVVRISLAIAANSSERGRQQHDAFFERLEFVRDLAVQREDVAG